MKELEINHQENEAVQDMQWDFKIQQSLAHSEKSFETSGQKTFRFFKPESTNFGTDFTGIEEKTVHFFHSPFPSLMNNGNVLLVSNYQLLFSVSSFFLRDFFVTLFVLSWHRYSPEERHVTSYLSPSWPWYWGQVPHFLATVEWLHYTAAVSDGGHGSLIVDDLSLAARTPVIPK